MRIVVIGVALVSLATAGNLLYKPKQPIQDWRVTRALLDDNCATMDQYLPMTAVEFADEFFNCLTAYELEDLQSRPPNFVVYYAGQSITKSDVDRALIWQH